MRAAGPMAAGLFAVAVVTAMTLNPGRPVAPFRAAADAIPVPATWTLLDETVRSDAGPFGCGILAYECPGVVRHYAVVGEGPIAALVGNPIRDRLRALGFTTTGGWADRCTTRQVGDSCVFAMERAGVLARVLVQAPAELSTSNGGLSGRVSVSITLVPG